MVNFTMVPLRKLRTQPVFGDFKWIRKSENIFPHSSSSKGRVATDSRKQGKWSEKLPCREKIREFEKHDESQEKNLGI